MRDHEAERALLGALMLADVDPYVSADDFDAESHQLIYRAIAGLRAEGKPVDQKTVRVRMGDDAVAAIGGPGALLDIASAVPSAYHADSYAEIVRENARRRRVYRHATLAAKFAETGDAGMESEAQAVVDSLEQHETKPTAIGTLLDQRYTTLHKKRPYVSLDQFPGIHLHFGDFAILAGRPSTGKSALAQQLGEEWASRNLRTRIYSLEMSDMDYIDRHLMRSMDAVTTDTLDDGLTPEMVERVKFSTKASHSWPLDIIDRPNMGVDGLVREVRRAGRKGTRIVIVDYLQLLVGKERNESRYEAVTEASRRLKLAAREANVLIVALAQLNRGSVKDDGTLRPPSMSDLRESGALEQDADDIILIHRYAENDEKIRQTLTGLDYTLEYDHDDVVGGIQRKAICHVDFAKMRRGVTGKRFCWFDGPNQAFIPMDRKQEVLPL